MDFEDVKAAVKAAALNNELSCQETEHLADKLGVEYSVVARAANHVGVRQRLCQWAPFCVCPPSSHRTHSHPAATSATAPEPAAGEDGGR